MRRCSSRLLPHVLARAMIFLCLLVLMSTALVGCGQPTPAPKLNALQSWITQHAVPLKTVDPQGPLDDLEPLRQIVGPASIVGLGEATHGSHEFFTMKQRLLEFLVEKMGFTMFAMEGSWSAGEQINQYIVQGQGDAGEVLRLFHFWTWNTQEVLDLLKWMRAYNADSNHLQKISFAGFDCQFIEPNTYESVTQYLQSVDPQRVATVAALYQGLRPDSGVNMLKYEAAYQQLPQSIQQRYLTQARQVYDLLNQQQAAYEKRSSPQAFALAVQEARVIVQHAQIFSVNPDEASGFRDEIMAENIAWLHEQTQSGKKLVLWAHDAHIATGDQMAMGMHLRERYGTHYLAVGMSFYEGSFNAHGLDTKRNLTPVQSFTIQAPNPESYNYTFGRLGFSLYALDLRMAPNGPVSHWLDGPHRFFAIGAFYNDKDESYSYTPLPLRKSFDVIVHIQKVTASQLLLPLEE